MTTIVTYCRNGFEQDAAEEIAVHAAQHQGSGQVQCVHNSGYVTYVCESTEEAERLLKQINFHDLVFARQWFCAIPVMDMPAEDRVGAIKAAVDQFPLCGELSVETTDTNEAKTLAKFCRKIAAPLTKALQKRNKLTRAPKMNRPVLHVLFLSNQSAYVGYSFRDNRSRFEMGIPRLKMPSDAPSRSTLKLDEAIHLFLTKEEQTERLRQGMRAVDLGACPGGWTYQLVRRGLYVTAVDNGAIRDDLMKTGQVEHLKEDGFKFRPVRPQDNTWLVCDMVEQPSRITDLMISWALAGCAREFVFILKLPMKKRYLAVSEALEKIRHTLSKQAIEFSVQAKQLYHDREEVTVYLRVLS